MALWMVVCVGIWICWSALHSVRNSIGGVVYCLVRINIEACRLSWLVCLFFMTQKIWNSLSKFLFLCLMLFVLWFILFHGEVFCCGAFWFSYITRVGYFEVNPLFCCILIIILCFFFFFSFILFLICFLPSHLGRLKGGFLIMGHWLLSRWVSRCKYRYSIDSPMGWMFLSFSWFFIDIHISNVFVGWLRFLSDEFEFVLWFRLSVLSRNSCRS